MDGVKPAPLAEARDNDFRVLVDDRNAHEGSFELPSVALQHRWIEPIIYANQVRWRFPLRLPAQLPFDVLLARVSLKNFLMSLAVKLQCCLTLA